MDVKVYFKDGRIEAHSIPDYVGSSHTSSEDFGGSETLNEIDRVRGIVERFVRDAEGYWVEQVVDKPLDVRMMGDRLTKSKGKAEKRLLVVSSAELSNVKLIAVDGEQVYPEEKQVHGDSYIY